MYNSRFVSREERIYDAEGIKIEINKMVKDGWGHDEPQKMSAWKCVICAYFSNAFHLGEDDKRWDDAYHRSMFDILHKDMDCFVRTTMSNNVNVYEWVLQDAE